MSLQKSRKVRTGLNIKDPEAYQLAHEVAGATGDTMTRVVIEALREYRARLRKSGKKASVEELLSIASRAAAEVKRPYIDHAELLYDEDGLPK